MITFWTIYNRPMTHGYVAVRSVLPSEPDELLEEADRAEYVMLSNDLEAIRQRLTGKGHACHNRDPEDHKSIVEVWIRNGSLEQKSGHH